MPICDECGGKFEGISKNDLMHQVVDLRAFLKKIRRIMDRESRKNGNGRFKAVSVAIGKVVDKINGIHKVHL